MATGGNFLVNSWYRSSAWLYLLWPLSLFYRAITALRKSCYRSGVLRSSRFAVPVIVVGNITVGGSGKTPLVVGLVETLKQAGFKPGVVSRGYGSSAPNYPFHVSEASSPKESGDEPLLIASRTHVPVVIDADRSRAVDALLNRYECDVVITDDGLQHYALQRQVEIAVIDSHRRLGNGLCLPAGPLREPAARLDEVDFIINNGAGDTQPNTHTPQYTMLLQATSLFCLDDDRSLTFEEWDQSNLVHAVVGIGNPDRFFNTLRSLGFTIIEHEFPDHYQFSEQDIYFDDGLPVIMTEKDAVKIKHLNVNPNSWYLPVSAVIENHFYQAVISHIQKDKAA